MSPNWGFVIWGLFCFAASAVMFRFGDRIAALNRESPFLPKFMRERQTPALGRVTAFGFLAMGLFGVIVGVFFPGHVK